MITNAKETPIPTAPPTTMAIAKSKPASACHDMPPLLCRSAGGQNGANDPSRNSSPKLAARSRVA